MLIYKITNDINNRIYIGQTTRNLLERINSYKSEIKYQKQNPRPIIAAMQKYGIEHFHFVIIEDNIKSKEELDLKEQYYIQYYQSLCDQMGYNVELGGNSNGKHSEITKQKISQAQLGKKNHMYGKTGLLNVTSKQVIDLTTGIIYGSASEAGRQLNLNFVHICSVARGERGSTGGRVFRFCDINGNIEQPQQIAAIKKIKDRQAVLPEYQQYINSKLTFPNRKKK